jgi:16S rRNA (guanine527-N7)-methyltransferase
VLGGKIVNIEKFIITGTELSRSFVIIEKVKHTPRPYPRKAGIPSRNPL